MGLLSRLDTYGKSTEREAFTAATLDSMWLEAESLGSVRVDRSFGDDVYEVTIVFTTKSGSRIYAKGKHPKIQTAIGLAIDEARRLKD